MQAIVRELGAADDIRIECKARPGSIDDVALSPREYYRKGLGGFDPDIKVIGIEHALSNPSVERSRIVWNRIAVKYSACIKGKLLLASRQDFSRDGSKHEEKEVTSEFGELLLHKPWLPDRDGECRCPSQLSLDDLPESFARDERLRDQLDMKKDIVGRLAKEAGVSADDISFLKQHLGEFQKWKAGITTRTRKPAFPTRASPDPDRRGARLAGQLGDAPEKGYEQRKRSVRTTRGTIDPDPWLRNHYTNETGQMVCQICRHEMPFRKRDGEYYFEAVEALTRELLPKEHDEQFLALCPVCAAKYCEFAKHDPEEMKRIRDRIIGGDSPTIPVQLDQGATISFVEVHFLDLKTILQGTGSCNESRSDGSGL